MKAVDFMLGAFLFLVGFAMAVVYWEAKRSSEYPTQPIAVVPAPDHPAISVDDFDPPLDPALDHGMPPFVGKREPEEIDFE